MGHQKAPPITKQCPPPEQCPNNQKNAPITEPPFFFLKNRGLCDLKKTTGRVTKPLLGVQKVVPITEPSPSVIWGGGWVVVPQGILPPNTPSSLLKNLLCARTEGVLGAPLILLPFQALGPSCPTKLAPQSNHTEPDHVLGT